MTVDRFTSRISGADGLRAIACLLVVWHHTSQKLDPSGTGPIVTALQFLGMRGEVGVSMFFVLSGCLLSLPFWKAFAAKAQFPSLKHYALRRLARIAPAFWANLTISTLLATLVFGLEFNLPKFFTGLFFVNSYNYTTFFPAELNGPLWSIGLEVSCYLLLPFALYAIYKIAKTTRGAIVGLSLQILVLQLINPLLIQVFMTDTHEKGWQFGLDGGAKLWIPYWNIGTFFSQFLMGSLAALVIVSLGSKARKQSKLYDAGFVAFSSAATILVVWRLIPGNPDSLTQQPYVAPYFAALVAGALVCLNSSVVLGRLVDNRPLRWIAKLSFGIYLWHMVVIEVIARQFNADFVYGGMHNVLVWVLTSAIVLVVATALAAISWKWLESPILKLVNQKIQLSGEKSTAK